MGKQYSGTVKWFSDAKGYGFVATTDFPGKDIFVHYSNIVGQGRKSLIEGEPVRFDVSEGPKGLIALAVERG